MAILASVFGVYYTEGKMIKGKDSILEPREITRKELQLVHTDEYLDSLTVCLLHALLCTRVHCISSKGCLE